MLRRKRVIVTAALVVVGLPVGLLLALRVSLAVLDETDGELVSSGVARDDLFHGTEDPVVPYPGGTTWVSPVAFPPVEEWASKWAGRNRCSGSPVETRPAADVTRRAWVDCAASVVLYTLHGAGRTWPGGKPLPRWLAGPTASGIDATARLWTFFRAHSLDRRRGSAVEGAAGAERKVR